VSPAFTTSVPRAARPGRRLESARADPRRTPHPISASLRPKTGGHSRAAPGTTGRQTHDDLRFMGLTRANGFARRKDSVPTVTAHPGVHRCVLRQPLIALEPGPRRLVDLGDGAVFRSGLDGTPRVVSRVVPTPQMVTNVSRTTVRLCVGVDVKGGPGGLRQQVRTIGARGAQM
jgi:hypothetical protein